MAMSYDERGTWVYLMTSAGAYLVYLAIILGRVLSTPVEHVSYVAVLLWTAGASILASTVAMALARWDYFWIANVIYLGFVLWAVAGSVVKVAAYHRGL
jgi:hypothetical protein